MTASIDTTDPKKLMQHYAVWQAFNKKVYTKTLTSEHIIMNGNEKHIETVMKIESNKDTDSVHVVAPFNPVYKKCIFLEKDGRKYILPSKYKQLLPLNVKIGYECYLKKTDPTVHVFIEEPSIAKITPERTMSFKTVLQVFNPMTVSNPKVLTFLKMLEFASSYKGVKCCVCGNPASMKNSCGTIFRYILNNIVRIGKPTLAKLETLFYYNQKVYPDEMTSLTPANVREVESFFLTISDDSPDFTKHSMATKKDMNNINATNLSCIFTYNRVQDLNNDAQFFDDIWQNVGAFRSRFPQLLLPESIIMEELPKLNQRQANKVMELNYDPLRTLCKNIIYYVNHMDEEMHGWERGKLKISSTRHRTNLQGVLDVLDVASDTQEEYDDWLQFVNNCVTGYKAMVYKREKGGTLE